ncbi:MAG: hypothetical protein ACRD26_04550 [Vicinamibacterales bacterium]
MIDTPPRIRERRREGNPEPAARTPLLVPAGAALIAVAAVAGRYHYLVDVLLGLLVGAVVPALTGS